MKQKIALLLFTSLFLTNCNAQADCSNINQADFNSYNQALEVVQNADFTIEEVETYSDWINEIAYYSCNSKSGYMVISMDDKEYIYTNVPIALWSNFKDSDSKGKFYHQNIRNNQAIKLSLK